LLTSGQRAMLPEEIELARLEAEQTELKERVTSAELILETTKTETAQFQHRYYRAVGRLYAQLDELDAHIANLRSKQAPDDAPLKAQAQAANRQANKSAEEAGLVEAQPEPPPIITSGLKHAYRQAVKLIHPDLATTERERQRRTELMAQVNLAYERGDQKAIEKIIEEFGEDPEAIVGEDVASRIVKAIRRIAQLHRRLAEVRREVEVLKKSEIFQLKQTVEQAEAIGSDVLGDLAKQLAQEISARRTTLDVIRQGKRDG
jgi:hypothetical protein